MGRYETTLASFIRPIRMRMTPRRDVPAERSTMEVLTTALWLAPSASIWIAMVLDMLDKKMRPASWTVPIAKLMEENNTKLSWWTREEKMTSFDRAFM
jgi:hypothetical protein